MRFFAPSALETRRVHQHGFARPRFVPSSGFLNLLTVFSSPNPPALFHAGNTHGVYPTELGTPDPATLLSEEMPSCGCSDLRPEGRLSSLHFRALIRAGSRIEPPGGWTLRLTAALLGLSPSRVRHLASWAGAILSQAFTSDRLPKLPAVRAASQSLSRCETYSSARDRRGGHGR